MRALRGSDIGYDGIIQSFGSYEVPDNKSYTYQIILELAHDNLDSYFCSKSPPESPEEILHFWQRMLSMVEIIKKIHGFKVDGQIGQNKYAM